jgi:FkbM family methyltransferase
MKLMILAGKAWKLLHSQYRLFLWNLNRAFRTFAVINTKQGKFKIAFLEKESIGRSLYTTGQYEMDLIKEVTKFLRANSKIGRKGSGTALDIGANNGVISIGLLQTGEFQKAIAFEPEPRNFSLLEFNVALNGLKDRFICMPYAVADAAGELRFELSDTNYGDHRVRADSQAIGLERQSESKRRLISVKADQLDALLSSIPQDFVASASLVWLDVQGYEGYVFKGGKKFLSTGIPVIAEIWPYGIQRAGMTQEQFCEIARELWSHYWIRRRGKFIMYPIETLETVFQELGDEGAYDNLIFMR